MSEYKGFLKDISKSNTNFINVITQKHYDKHAINESSLNINVNLKDQHENTLLMLSCRHGNIKVVKRLLWLTPPADYNVTKRNGINALMIASRHGHINCVRELLKMPDININQRTYYRGKSAVVIAYLNGHYDIFKLLLKVPGIEINTMYLYTNYTGNVPLSVTYLLKKVCQDDYKGGHTELIEALLEHPDVIVPSEPLRIACERGSVEVVKTLLKYRNINVFRKDDRYRDALMIAKYNKDKDIIKMLNDYIINTLDCISLPNDIIRLIVYKYI